MAEVSQKVEATLVTTFGLYELGRIAGEGFMSKKENNGKDPNFWNRYSEVYQHKLADGSRLELQMANREKDATVSTIDGEKNPARVEARLWHVKRDSNELVDGKQMSGAAECYILAEGKWYKRTADTYTYNKEKDTFLWDWKAPKEMTSEEINLDINHKLNTLRNEAKAKQPADDPKRDGYMKVVG